MFTGLRKMINVYYVYEETERKREKKGFSCTRYKINHKIGEYNTKEEAVKHPLFEHETDDGFYRITEEVLEEKIVLPPKNPPVEKKNKKK